MKMEKVKSRFGFQFYKNISCFLIETGYFYRFTGKIHLLIEITFYLYYNDGSKTKKRTSNMCTFFLGNDGHRLEAISKKSI
ncbi:hypothetical protein J2S15_000066 [Breznakia pachnodae]|uniref:Uncharacterized protein n=1 Tax=Breznakia pachnodae TaxID=265178 RepID=A0ABU0DXH4_9FIRM|nr:hypothetical protein [Breznakia pachnodae]